MNEQAEQVFHALRPHLFSIAYRMSLEHKHPAQVVYQAARVNGEPGLLRYVQGMLESVQSFIVDNERIVAVFIMRNPDKLASIPQTL